MAQRVWVADAPGFEDFEAVVIPGLREIPVDDPREFTAVVMTIDEEGHKDLFVVPSISLIDIPE